MFMQFIAYQTYFKTQIHYIISLVHDWIGMVSVIDIINFVNFLKA